MSFSRLLRGRVGKRRSATHRRRMICETLESRVVLSATIGNNIDTGDQLRNYRLAIATTEEYTTAIGGEAAALASVNQLVSDLNAIYEKELAIHFDLVTGVNTIFEAGDGDGLTNGNLGVIVNEGTTVIDGVIGSSAYDVGHVLGTFGGGGTSGLAYLGVVGNASLKGGGGTVVGDIANVGGEGWTLVVAHELGHQFDAAHTFNSVLAGTNCTTSTRNASTAYEPASGSTLMSYAGICGADNLQSSEDPVFHSASFEDINTYIAGVGRGPNSTTPIVNDVPSVNGGADYTIPADTPFSLTAVGTDANALTYSWEQLDLGAAQNLPLSDLGSGPLFRAFAPTPDPTRVFPRLEGQLAGVNTAAIGEVLPSTNRDLNFRVTVRDDLGGVSSDDVLITSVDTGSPFAITNLNSSTALTGAASQSITWDVAGTNGGSINVSNVAIELSADGGLTYPYVLAASTANDGSESVTLPNVDIASARVRVRAIGNVFFDINDAELSITSDAGQPGLQFVESGGDTRPIEGTFAGAEDSYTIALNTNPSGSVTVEVAADAQTLVSSDGVSFGSTAQFVLSSTAAQTVFVRGVVDGLEEGPHVGVLSHSVVASTSASYPNGTPLGFLNANVVDAELPPVVGIDFDFQGNAPTNWTDAGFLFEADGTNLIRDDGAATSIDISSNIFGSSSASSAGPSSATVPRHVPSLLDLGAYSSNDSGNTFTSTWSDLTPGNEYAVYVFGFESRSGTYIQDVTITGSNTVAFTQSLTNGNLHVNDSVGSSSNALPSYASLVTADSSGEIDISVAPASGSAGVALAGLAIGEIPTPPPPPEINVQGGTPAADIPDGDTTPSVADDTDFGEVPTVGGSDTHTFTIQNTGSGPLSVTQVTTSGTNAGDFTISNFSAGSVTAGGTLTFDVTFDPSANGVRTATVEIVSDDADENPYDFSVTGTGVAVSVLNSLVFNEVLVDPNSSGSRNFDTDGDGSAEEQDEFIEIYNTTGNTLDISGLQFWDRLQDNYFTIPASTTLGANSFAVVVGDVAGGSLPSIEAGSHAFSTGGVMSLNNSGENLVLFDPATDEFIQAIYNGAVVDTPASPAAGDYDGFSSSATLLGSVFDFGSDTDGTSRALSPDGTSPAVDHDTIGSTLVLATPGASNVAPVETILTVNVIATQVSEGDGTAATTVEISRTGDTTAALDLDLTSSDTSEATVQPTVTIPAGQASVTVDVNAIDDAFLDGDFTVSISAAETGYDGSITPDTTFSGDGSLTTTLRYNLDPFYYDIDIQDDGKIVIAGRDAALDDTWQVIRVNPDGTLDNTFGTGGIVTTTFTGFSTVRPQGVMLHDDGRITVIGAHGTGGVFARYTSTGSPDTTFSTDGKADVASVFARKAILHSDGSFTAVGGGRLLRIGNDGTPDAGFGSGGIITPTFDPVGDERMNDVVEQPDGKLVVSGEAFFSGANTRVFVARFNTDGTLDATYGSSGYQLLDAGFDFLGINAMTLHPDGGVVAIGDAGLSSDWILAKFDSSGNADTSFSSDGFTTLDFNGAGDNGIDVVVQDDGKIIGVGGAFVLGNLFDRAVARFNVNGSLDTSFSDDGFEIFAPFVPNQFEEIVATEIDSDGKLVTLSGASENFRVERWNLPSGLADSDSVDVTDDDVIGVSPLVGVDYDFTGNTPNNWTGYDFLFQASGSNLIDEDGNRSAIDIDSNIFGDSFASSSSPLATTIPQHTQSLSNIGGYSYNDSGNSFTSTFSDLIPGEVYRVYVFGYEANAGSYTQNVTLAGDNAPINFTQTLVNSNLHVNGSVGSDSSQLEDFAELVTADANGEILVTVAPGVGSAGVSLAGLAIQRFVATNDRLTVTIDETEISENGGTATGTVTRNTGTAGDLVVNLLSDDIGEATVPATVTIPNGSDFVTFPITAVDDSDLDGTQTVTITASATNFLSGEETIGITDDEAPTLGPLIGIDFDNGTNVPTNWTKFTSLFSASGTNLIGEDGVTTIVDVTSTFTGGFTGGSSGGPPASTVPQHTQSLLGLDGNSSNREAGTSFTSVFSDLIPGNEYRVYVFGTEDDFVFNYRNDVTIVGTNTVSFTTATLNDFQLNVNGVVGSSAQTLESYAELVYADTNGEISISVSAPAGADGYALAGLAIQQTDRTFETLTVTFDETEISENGGTATGTVSRNTGTTGDLLVTLVSDDTGEATVPASVTIPDGSDSVTFPVTAVDDSDLDGTQTVTITATATGISSGIGTIDVTDDEVLPPSLVGVDFASGGASPTNWTLNASLSASLTNLINEDGNVTPFDVNITGFAGTDVGTPQASQLPMHSQSLANIDGNFYANSPVTMVWSDLNPSREYEVYVFGLDTFADNQNVTITGANVLNFAQSFSGNQLFVNGTAGSSSQTLDSYAQILAPTPAGQITIGVSPVSAGQFLGIGGLAIREIAPPAAEFDFGDAPSSAQSGFASSYPVTDADSGAKHDLSGGGPTLGANVDSEADGVHSAAADADDTTDVPDDEDGVTFNTAIFASAVSSGTGSVDVDLQNADPTSNRLDAWIDFNRDGDWDDAGEQIFSNFNLGTSNGVQSLNFTIPQDSGSNVVSGTTFARFRVSTAGGLGVTGTASDGEVEDHAVAIVTVDPLIVDTLADESDGDFSAGDLSLREAIELSNARVGQDEIQFAPGLTGGTITLTIDELEVTDDLNLVGLGAANLTISGNDTVRVFDLQNGPNVSIHGLTIRDGRTDAVAEAGAGIRSTGILDLVDSIVTDNHTLGNLSDGGGIVSFGGSLTITDSTVSGNSTAGNDSFGGGISTNSATVIVTGSVIDGNTTASGGVNTGLGAGLVVISGDLTLSTSTVSNNTNTGAGSLGGGVVVSSGNLTINDSTISGNVTQGRGGGIVWGSATDTATVTNTTISGNTAVSGDGGGISVFQGAFNLRHSTVTGNTASAGGGGLASYSDGTAVSNTTILSSIIAGNANSDVDNVLTGSGTNTITSSGYNVVGTTNTTGVFVNTGDQTGVSDPGVAPLANNGGPTLTHALLANSPAIGTGDTTSTETNDQRGSGFARLVGSNVDVGAFELQATDPSVTLSADPSVIREADGIATVTATLSEISGDDVTVTLGTTGTATGGGADYNLSGTSIVIAAGTLSGSATVDALPDTVDENDETVIIDITSVTGGTENGTQQSTVTILDNVAPVVTLPSSAATFSEGQLPVLVDPAATATDTDSADLDGGTLSVEITTAGTANDRLTIREEGTGPGEVSLSGTSVVIDGVARGSWSGGQGATPLNVNLLSGTTPAHVQAILRNIQFNNVSTDPSTTTRVITVNLTDGDGGTATPATQNVNVVAVPDLDFGDAPTATQAGGGTFVSDYPVTLAQDGARHTPTGPTLGTSRDAEANGLPSADADGDDLDVGDDEDGVQFGGLGVTSTMAALNVDLGNAANAKVDAWIDFNQDGDWDDTGEQILVDVAVVGGLQTLNYNVPAGILAGETYARVRVSSAGGLSPTGLAADGEVEDYRINIGPPQVDAVIVNGGDVQQSGITEVQVRFDRIVNFDFSSGDVFQFLNTTTNQVVDDVFFINTVGGKTVVDFTFTPGSSVNAGGGLLDGNYQLTIDATKVTSGTEQLDGNGDGTPGDDHVFGASAVDNFYRKYGDADGNGTVELPDFAAFRSAFGSTAGGANYEEGLDSDNNGTIDLFDFAVFRGNFGS